MFSFLSNQVSLALRSPRVLIAAGIGVAAAVGVTSYVVFRRPEPTGEELERERRDLLARTGRITDGNLLDSMTDTLEYTAPETLAAETGGVFLEPDASGAEHKENPAPRIILYNYRIGGVAYECAQDVTTLADRVRGLRSDLPIQVRYEPHNPGNSIVVAESWSGLRLISPPSAPARNQR